MKNEINTQRQSSSTADGTPKINPKASPPLDEASCSASSLIGELEVMAKAGKLGNPMTYNPKELDALVASGKCYFSDVYTPPKNRTIHQSMPC